MKDKKRWIGFSFAWNGLIEAVKSERNFQYHIVTAFIVIVFGIFFQISRLEWGIIILVIGLVLVSEMINSTVEKLIDYLKPDIHPTAKVIKDIAAGSVLIAAIIAAIIGLIVFIPKINAFL